MASIGVVNLDPDPVLRLVRSAPMLNKILAAICKAEGLPSGGVKADLQARISDNIRRYVAAGNIAGFEKIKAMLEHPDQIPHIQPTPRNGIYPPSPSVQSPFNMPPQGSIAYPTASRGVPKFRFKPSPFYRYEEQLGEAKLCDVMAHHRHTVGLQIKPMDYPILHNVQGDKTLRVMVFSCEVEAGQGERDVAFPYQSEIKVNGGEIKANLRGLKNKPGSTRPVDITDALRLRQAAYSNNVEMTYALTTKKFYLMIHVVRAVAVAELVKKLEIGKKISRDSVINEMVTKARDPDIVATSSVLSLKCPLSYARISLPCRSVSCRHTQCFDATSYLQLQEQGPTWQCPICSIVAPFESLAVDEYVRNILSNTSGSVEQVTIEPDGRWSQHSKPEASKNNGATFGSDDEDLVEVKDTRVNTLKMTSTPVPSVSSTRTPPSLSREPSTALASTYPSTSGKRTHAELIDLTLSDDDDDLPASRPAKRPFNAYVTPQSLFNGSNGQNGYQMH